MGGESKLDILGVSFDNVSFDEALARFLRFLDENKPRAIYTPNPEFVMAARKDEAFRTILNRGDMLIPDGIGIVYASRLGPVKLKERVAGYDLLQAVFGSIKNTGHTVYFYGGAPGAAELAREKMESAYPGLKIVGVCDGYVRGEGEAALIDNIKELKPDILLVGIGFPQQEMWIDKNKNRLPCKVLMGVGGSLDGMGGRVKRAPKLFIKLNLEWLYRLAKQPSRFRRQLNLPAFMAAAVWERIFKKR